MPKSATLETARGGNKVVLKLLTSAIKSENVADKWIPSLWVFIDIDDIEVLGFSITGMGLVGDNTKEMSDEEDIDGVDPALVNVFQPPLSPGASLNDLQQGKNSIPPVLRSGSVVRNLENSFKLDEQRSKVKTTMENIEDEVLFWKPSIVCYVLGSNPPLHIIEGFSKRVWKDKVDRVKMLSFGQMENPIMVDEMTRERERLNYPRVMIKVSMDQHFPDTLEFEDEYGSNTTIGVKYEWKPCVCTHCSGLGHVAAKCKKNATGKKEWIVKADNRKQNQVYEEGFTKVTRSRKVETTVQKPAEIEVGNTFQVLDMVQDAGEGSSVITNGGNTEEGGEPSILNE
uniref:DUF4283 domain-containing protein n=1 Tax=Cannabis sativa TaxID=3483 RepID=A0A803PRT0_CANSA